MISNNGSKSPTTFFYKPSKLTNKNMLFKRNSIGTNDLIKQNNFTVGLRKSSGRNSHQVSKSTI